MIYLVDSGKRQTRIGDLIAKIELKMHTRKLVLLSMQNDKRLLSQARGHGHKYRQGCIQGIDGGAGDFKHNKKTVRFRNFVLFFLFNPIYWICKIEVHKTELCEMFLFTLLF